MLTLRLPRANLSRRCYHIAPCTLQLNPRTQIGIEPHALNTRSKNPTAIHLRSNQSSHSPIQKSYLITPNVHSNRVSIVKIVILPPQLDPLVRLNLKSVGPPTLIVHPNYLCYQLL